MSGVSLLRVDPDRRGVYHQCVQIPTSANILVHNTPNMAVFVEPFTPNTAPEGLYLQDGTLVVFARQTFLVVRNG